MNGPQTAPLFVGSRRFLRESLCTGQGAWVTHVRLLRPARSGIFGRSFRLHSVDYACERIAQICSLGAALATAPMSHPGSMRNGVRCRGWGKPPLMCSGCPMKHGSP